MKPASEIMRDSITKDLIPSIVACREAYAEQGNIDKVEYLDTCLSHLREAVDIGERCDVGEHEDEVHYWEGWRGLALTTLATCEIAEQLDELRDTLVKIKKLRKETSR